MRTLTAALAAFLLVLTASLYSQNDFKLGFTGAYPNHYVTATGGINWSWYTELSMNTWSGWWVGDNHNNTGMIAQLFANFQSNNMDGYFQPDTIRWAGYGRLQVNEAESTNTAFRYNIHNCGSNVTDNSQFGTGQLVRYFDVNDNCLNTSEPVLAGVNENGFQSYSGIHDPQYQVPFPYNNYSGNNRDSIYLNNYYVKPRMRINASETSTNKPVVKVIVKSFDGVTTILERTINTFDFKDVNNNYDGRYLEDYLNIILRVRGDVINVGRGDHHEYDPVNCHVDYQIYWYGQVNVWIDYVKVMDEAAYRLLNPNPFLNLDGVLQQKIDFLKSYDTQDRLKGFYMEEVDYSNLACLKYLNELLPSMAQNDNDYRMQPLINPWSFQRHLKDQSPKFSEYIQAVDPAFFMLAWYPVGPYGPNPTDQAYIPERITSFYVPDYMPHDVQGIVDSYYPYWRGNDVLYNSFVQTMCEWTSDTLEYFHDFCQTHNKELVMVPQFHSWLEAGHDPAHREPMNAELGALLGIGLCRGVKGIMPFAFESSYFFEDTKMTGGNGIMYSPPAAQTTAGFTFGMTDFTNSIPWYGTHKRTRNLYHENKWQYVADLFAKIKIWGPILAASSNTQGYSVESEGSNHEFIENFVSIVPHLSGQNPCVTYGPGLGEFADCPEESYWEMGFFGGERNTRYFMLVNRRCVPENDSHFTQDNRFVKIKFNGTNLPGSWKNWQLSEVGGSTRPVNFSRYSGYISLGTDSLSMGWFKPGESKLFKITPTSETGGDLVCDEVITGESFTCEDTIFNNGYNITIGAGTNMKFTDSSCIVMNGGVFAMGDQQVSGSQNITFDAESGNLWRGHSFTGTEIHIYGAAFSGLANDSVYALNMIDCPVVDIRNTTFNSAGSLKGGINAVYYANEESATVNFYIGGNTFTATSSTLPTVNVSSFAGMTTPLIIENNTFTNGNTAIFLSGVIGGAVKNNNISENYTGISLLSSYIDVSGNTISSTVNGSTGIFAAGGSEIKMNSAGSKELGGMNNISNEGTGTNNIKVEGSYFLTDEGQNIFNISDFSTSYHLYGYFPQYIAIPYDETMNCFKVSGSPTNTPYNLVTDGYQGSQITFNFNPFLTGCDPEQGENMIVLDLGDGINDTIYSNGSGSGGGHFKQTTPSGFAGHPSFVRRGAFTPQNVNTAYDSICMLMRSRNYSSARTKCIEMISNYPDSIQSLNALAKLYLASVSSNANITDLKVFYENLILNHPNNTSLVKRANYYILKCKVKLHEYTSALAGFQQIINENPYSYEGLIARWDYMATSLLVPGGGGEPMNADFGFSIADLKAEDLEAGNPQSDIRDPNSWDDKSPFTKEQRVNIRKSINTAIESDKNDNDRKIRVLETKSDQGDLNAIKELAQVKALKQVVKTEKPRSITEHIKLVMEDIQKVFGSVTGGKGKDMSNIPTVYRLSQNYPNPFNPVTKINYDLPKDAKVNVIIYDILGREIKRLVNNELKTAGTYIIDFNAANYASGVYFYRIEAEELGGNKFVDSKKMVLIK